MSVDRYFALSGYEHIITQKPESPEVDDAPASEIARKIIIGAPLSSSVLYMYTSSGIC